MKISVASPAGFTGISKWSAAIVAGALASALTAAGYQAVTGGTTWDAPVTLAASTPAPPVSGSGTTWD